MTTPLAMRMLAGAVLSLLATAIPQHALAASEDAAASAWLERSSRSGPVEATIRLRPPDPKIGDPIELELVVRAESGVEILMPEFGEALGRFQIVDFAPQSRIEDDGKRVSVQHYTLAPTISGEHRVPPLLIEFVDHRAGHEPSPADEDAYELLTDAIDFEVSSVLSDDAPRDLRPALAALPPLGDGRAGAAEWTAIALTFLALVAAIGLAVRRFTGLGARESPYAAARRELKAVLDEGRPNPDDREQIDAFFVALSSIVRRYIERRFALRSPELTTEEFLAELRRSPEMLRSQQTLLAELLGVADLVKFAGHTPDPSVIGHSVEIAGRFLEATREAGDAEPDDAGRVHA